MYLDAAQPVRAAISASDFQGEGHSESREVGRFKVTWGEVLWSNIKVPSVLASKLASELASEHAFKLAFKLASEFASHLGS